MKDIFELYAEFLDSEKRLKSCREMTTEALKLAWDSFDANAKPWEPRYFWPESGPHIEDVHRVLNERGEGEYCAC